jgi:uncharacterized protein with FMN-binding domain
VKKIGNGVVALSSAAIIAIYAAGHARTRPAAEEMEAVGAQRRPAIPQPAASTVTGAASSVSSAGSGFGRPNNLPAKPVAAPPPEAAASASTPAPSTTAPAAAAAPTAASITTGGEVLQPKPAPATENAGAVAPAEIPPPAAKKTWKDGTYRSWGRSRHGDMLAFVVIENGRIVHAGVDKCETRWPCTIVAHLYPQVLARQSAEVDYVTGATQSANAFYYGIVDALAMAEGAEVAPRPIPQ